MKLSIGDLVTYAGLTAATVIFAANGLDPKMATNLPGFFHRNGWHFVPAALLVIAGVSALGKRFGWWSKQKLVRTAELMLEFHGNEEQPSEIRRENIWRWYYAWRSMGIRDQSGKSIGEQHFSLLFITFEPEVAFSTLLVESRSQSPRWQVEQFNQRFAIVGFYGPFQACTITVVVRPPLDKS